MFSAKKLQQYAKDILFPPFSERELITLAYLIVLMVIVGVISDPSSIVTGIIDLAKRLTLYGSYGFWDFIGAALGLIELLIYGLGALFTIWILYDIAIKQRKESFETKKFLAYVFYAALSLISFGALSRSLGPSLVALYFGPLLSERLSLGALVNNLIISFLLFRSVLTALLTLAAAKLKQTHLLAVRMTDEQLSRIELLILIIAGTGLFLFVFKEYDRLAALLLSYFYVTLLLDIYRKIFPQPNPTHKSIREIKLK